MLQMSRAVVTHRRLLLFKWLMVFLPSATVAVGHSLIAHTGAETHGLPTITATLPVTFFGLVLTYIFVETLFRVLRRLQVEALARLLGTRWGLFQHYWVLISFLLTVIATAVLLLETRTISYLAGRPKGSEAVTRGKMGRRQTLGSTFAPGC